MTKPNQREFFADFMAEQLAGIAGRPPVEPEPARESMGDAGCPRCRQDLVRFTREVKLPRFTMREGETWDMPQRKYTADGGAHLGAGIVPPDSFEIVVVNVCQSTGCDCGYSRDRQAQRIRRLEVEP